MNVERTVAVVWVNLTGEEMFRVESRVGPIMVRHLSFSEAYSFTQRKVFVYGRAIDSNGNLQTFDKSTELSFSDLPDTAIIEAAYEKLTTPPKIDTLWREEI